MISLIPVENLESIKEWLDECNIKYYEGPANLNWKQILQTIRENPKKFWEDGGWNFLNTESSSEEEDAADEEESVDAYVCSDQEDEDEYAPSTSADEDEGADEGEDEAEDSAEEGLDWDEMEARAAAEDRKKNWDKDETDTRKRRRPAGNAAASQGQKRAAGSTQGQKRAAGSTQGQKRGAPPAKRHKPG